MVFMLDDLEKAITYYPLDPYKFMAKFINDQLNISDSALGFHKTSLTFSDFFNRIVVHDNKEDTLLISVGEDEYKLLKWKDLKSNFDLKVVK